METLEFRAMNTSVLLAVDGPDWAALGLQDARMFIEECERRFSRFLFDSEISQLNRAAGEWVGVSDDLLDMLETAYRLHEETERLFDPSILTDLKRLGYDRSMDEVRTRKDIPSASARTVKPAFLEIGIDHRQKRVRLPKGLELDLGGLAKGWIVEKAANLLNTYASVCAANAGGDIFFIGEPLDGLGWNLQLEDPRDPSQYLTALHVHSGAVATSSITKRTWKQGGKIRHHLIDPRTGEPAQSKWLSVTVFASKLTLAEVYAKALLLAGETGAGRLLEQRPDLSYLAVEQDGSLTGSNLVKEFLL